MNKGYKIKFSLEAEHQFRKLSKKYKGFKSDILEFLELLSKNPKTGVPYLGKMRKVRIQISAKNKGKSGGARAITYLARCNEFIYILFIYDKSDVAALSKSKEKELKNAILDLDFEG